MLQDDSEASVPVQSSHYAELASVIQGQSWSHWLAWQDLWYASITPSGGVVHQRWCVMLVDCGPLMSPERMSGRTVVGWRGRLD